MTAAPSARPLAEAITGSVIDRRSDDYEAHRRALVWNGRPPDRFPELIVRPGTEGGAAAAIRFARDHGLRVGVRGSGHSYSGIFMCDGGMLIDISALKAIAVDVAAGQAVVGPGATSGAIDAALAPHGLAFPVGHGGTVGIGGFLIGGGLGINGRAWGGMSCFSIIAADVLLADGSGIHASASENDDIYWALRGGGPGLPFVVTRFHLRCYRRPGRIAISNALVRFCDLPRVAQAIDAVAPRLDPRCEVMFGILPAPPGLPDTHADGDHGRIGALTVVAFAENENEARTLHAPIAAHPAMPALLHREEIVDAAVTDMFAMTDALLSGQRVRAANILTDSPVAAIEILMRHVRTSPSAATVPLILWRGDPALPNAAFSAAGAYSVSTYAQWDDAGDDDANAGWLGRLYDELSGIATGAYINETDLEGARRAIGQCHSQASRARMRAIRARRDPDGVFHNPFPTAAAT